MLQSRYVRRVTAQRLAGAPTPAQWAQFWKMGDVNLDGYINDRDIQLIGYAYGAVPGDTNWIGACDLNGDGIVEMKELSIAAQNYGANIWDFFKLPKPSIGLASTIAVAGIGFGLGILFGLFVKRMI